MNLESLDSIKELGITDSTFCEKKEDIDKIKSGKRFHYICKKCGDVCLINRFSKQYIKEYKKFLCSKCRYVSHMNYFNVSKKIYKTKKERYGNPYFCNNEKRHKTVKSKYGVDNVFQLESVKDDIKNTKEKRYGNPHYKNPEKTYKTKKERYGNPYFCNNKKGFITYEKRTGYKTPFNNPAIIFARNRYIYNNINFDSTWELALWIYAKDHNEEIIREPIKLEFIYDGKIHKYYPDFKYKGKLIEIKGDGFYKDRDPTKRMIFPYNKLHSNSKIMTPKEKQYLDDLYEAKHQCGLKHGVEFWSRDKIKPIILYIKYKYGKNYLQRFKA